MKKRMNASVLLIAIVLSVLPVQASAQTSVSSDYPFELSITYPSATQSTIASGRDFYVIGNITSNSDAELPKETHFSVSLISNQSGETVREVYADIKDYQEGMYTEYDQLLTYSGDMSKSLMPDLVYDPTDVSTFEDVWRKCYYNDFNFTAVFAGGEYDLDINLVAEDGTEIVPLSLGGYTIVVAAEYDSEILAYTEQEIQIGVNQEKILSRFSPSAHLEKLYEQASEYGYVMYTDPFPGGWFPASYGIVGLEDGSVSGEILQRAILCDEIEYREGRAHFYIYNVSESSATNAIEISTIQTTQDIDNPERLEIYYYDIGEPSIGDLSGEFVKLDDGDKLQFTRADYQKDDESESNYVDVSTLDTIVSDNDVYDGIYVEPGSVISLYGVTAPIQNSPDQIHQDELGKYSLDNYVAELRYFVKPENGGSINMTFGLDVGLTRVINGQELPSVYEFKHDIPIRTGWAGQTIELYVQGYDAFGNPVEGANEVIQLHVSEASFDWVKTFDDFKVGWQVAA